MLKLKKKPDHNHDKYKLTAEHFSARLKQANLAAKVDIDDLLEKTDFDDKLNILINKLLQIKQNT